MILHVKDVQIGPEPGSKSALSALRSNIPPPGGAFPGGETGETLRALTLLGNGFVVVALVWGAATADLIDRRFFRSAVAFFGAALLCLFGVIHSSAPTATLFLPWRAGSNVPFHFAAAYVALGLIVLLASRGREEVSR